MSTNLRKKVFLSVFCLASITQGMYSTYFVSILTTIESIYQIKSKTAGALLSATELGQIVGSLFIAYYGGRGNKPKWIAACMSLSALAALISVSPHFIPSSLNERTATVGKTNIYQQSLSIGANSTLIDQLNGSEHIVHVPASASSYQPKDLLGKDVANKSKSESLLIDDSSFTTAKTTLQTQTQRPAQGARLILPQKDFFCHWESVENLTKRADFGAGALNNGLNTDEQQPSANQFARIREKTLPTGLVIVVFFLCLLMIGFGSTAITTLGIPFIDDIISKEESPLYLGLTISLKIFGPALGFLLGSLCIHLRLSKSLFGFNLLADSDYDQNASEHGAWWLGLIIISTPLLILSVPMYCLSRSVSSNQSEHDDFEDITYQAAEDHDIGGSHDFAPHMLALAHDVDLTSNRTCLSSEIDSSSREALQASTTPTHQHVYSNYVRNLTMEQSSNLDDDKLLLKQPQPQTKPMTIEGDQSDKGATKSIRQEVATRWDNGVCLVVNHFGRLESTRYSREAPSESSQALDVDPDRALTPPEPNHTQRPPPSTSRSSLATSMSNTADDSSDKVCDKKRRKRKEVQALAGLSQSLERLLTNRLLVLRILSNLLHIMPIAGFYTFLPKYLVHQYRITLSSSSAISGLAGILFVGLGAFLGGTIVRVLNVNSRLMTRWIALSALFYTCGMLILMNLGCGSNHIVHHSSRDFLQTDCSSSCKCSSSVYDPVCANGTTYLSPCLAGCRSYSISADRIIYDECGCMTKSELASNVSSTLLDQPKDHVNLNVALPGYCPVECSNLIWYIIVFSLSTLMHASSEVGSMMFNLRCVKTNDRTLALGLVTFASSLLGTIPCSVIYGTVVDLTCVFWDTIEPVELLSKSAIESEAMLDLKGACRVYDNSLFRVYLHGVTAFVMLLAFLVDCIICCRSDEVDFYDRSDSKADVRLGLKKSTETI